MRPRRRARARLDRHADPRRLESNDFSLRAGAAVVAGADEQLLGIFTHGDFVRHFQSDPRIGERLVAD